MDLILKDDSRLLLDFLAHAFPVLALFAGQTCSAG